MRAQWISEASQSVHIILQLEYSFVYLFFFIGCFVELYCIYSAALIHWETVD
jgi:hypothetical protein